MLQLHCSSGPDCRDLPQRGIPCSTIGPLIHACAIMPPAPMTRAHRVALHRLGRQTKAVTGIIQRRTQDGRARFACCQVCLTGRSAADPRFFHHGACSQTEAFDQSESPRSTRRVLRNYRSEMNPMPGIQARLEHVTQGHDQDASKSSRMASKSWHHSLPHQ